MRFWIAVQVLAYAHRQGSVGYNAAPFVFSFKLGKSYAYL
jgi:hypothetical protein